MIRAESFVDLLLRWFRDRQRDVPGRSESDPYRIWVAEVMAQQTRLATVRERYGHFLDLFPDVDALAAAESDEVLKAWEGMGYYARARNLHRAAQLVVAEHGGRVPEEPGVLRSLPGVGPYTAGAIASIAFGAPEPAVDGNARRVLSRAFDLAKPTPATLRATARCLLEVRPRHSAEINQAIMDLGGTVCLPRTPACQLCPVAGVCIALARGSVARRPPRRQRKAIPHQEIAVGLVWLRDRILIQRRPPEGLLGGLWEFPGGKVEAGEDPPAAMVRELREELGIEVTPGALIARVDHTYTHLRVTLHAFHARLVAGDPSPTQATAWTWVHPHELQAYAFPAANREILTRILSDEV